MPHVEKPHLGKRVLATFGQGIPLSGGLPEAKLTHFLELIVVWEDPPPDSEDLRDIADGRATGAPSLSLGGDLPS